MDTTTELLNDTDTAKLLHIKPATLRQWRMVGKGPKYSKMGKLVLYKRQTVERYLAELPEHSSTVEY